MKEYPLNFKMGDLPQAIAAIPFLQELPSDLNSEILMNTTILDCEPGDAIVQEGAMDQTIFFLLKGKVVIEKEGMEVGTTDREGTILGELALLRHGQRTATLVAANHVYCLKMSSDFLDHLTPEQSNAYWASLYRFLAELLARRLEKATLKLVRAEQMLAEAVKERNGKP